MKMKITNTCEQIKSTFTNGFDLLRWRKYAASISAELPAKCENDAGDYDFEKSVLPILNAALDHDKIDFVNGNFQAVIHTLNENLSALFEEEPDIHIVLYLGLCNGAGWATVLEGKNTVLLGIEKIIELDWGDERNMRALILHEVGHLWHKMYGKPYLPDFTKRRKAIQQLYQEGVAMVCEHILCGDGDFFHQDKDGWLQWCYANENDLKREYLHRLDANESVQDFFGDWCSYKGHSDTGYFLGSRFVRHLMKTHALKEIANLSYHKLNKEFIAFAGITIEPLSPADYPKCANIWNMQAQPLAETWRKEIESGSRLVFIYKINGAFIGEGALVSDAHDAAYTIPGKRVYISRMIVKKEYRNRGIGGEILDFLIRKAKELGYTEMTLGVDKDNRNALHLYRKHGFTEVLFEGTDENGDYYKLLKRI